MTEKYLAFVACALLLFPGCVSEENVSGTEVLNRSISAMDGVESYSFVIKSSMLLVGDESVLGGGTQRTDLVWSGWVDGKNRRMRIVASAVSGGSNESVEQYIIGGKQYIKFPEFNWLMNESGEAFWESKEYMRMSRASLDMSPVLVGEEAVNGVDCYLLGTNLSSAEALSYVMQQSGSAEGIKEVRSAQMREWVAKDTFLLMKSETEVDIVGMGVEAFINTTMDFGGYNAPLSIQLPAEAESAMNITGLMPGSGL